ncbi:Uncharacterised protein [Vibrio cholerae]|uniref:Uncharacterized protein n=1 Tax=Vibrio cholerae TaxID=666 RepID=A0A656AIN6_VIBCL|nr:Uncharacterised protein [Vibrio cholerae]CSB07661.1 Uncharacterised protein [Vibrio cholerae]CSB89712.1 Uncharacterised protein [Vibrio cholerae]CSC20580.1 Uncharacterised protein [Vibrio cholerae]CSC46996.1 Uncharacterised protein [Vibrio cholerae]
MNVTNKAHVEHAICFVKYQNFQLIKFDRILVIQIH